MQKIVISFALMIFLGFFSCSTEEQKSQSQKIDTQEFRKAANEFTRELKGVLISELQKGGPVKAVSVCADTAQILTIGFSEVNNLDVSRVALRTRNETNSPDDFELAVLEKFIKMQSEGELTDTTEYAEVIEENGSKFVRYLKPIIMAAPCLNCHGSENQIGNEVSELIYSIYPNDKARDFRIGDVRGALSIKKEI